MLVPIYLGLCGLSAFDVGNQDVSSLMTRSAGLSFGVAIAHTAAMMAAGGTVAFCIYRWLGLAFLSKSWFDLDVIWALSLILVGAIGINSALGA
jgi:hypothetical protein